MCVCTPTQNTGRGNRNSKQTVSKKITASAAVWVWHSSVSSFQRQCREKRDWEKSLQSEDTTGFLIVYHSRLKACSAPLISPVPSSEPVLISHTALSESCCLWRAAWELTHKHFEHFLGGLEFKGRPVAHWSCLQESPWFCCVKSSIKLIWFNFRPAQYRCDSSLGGVHGWMCPYTFKIQPCGKYICLHVSNLFHPTFPPLRAGWRKLPKVTLMFGCFCV